MGVKHASQAQKTPIERRHVAIRSSTLTETDTDPVSSTEGDASTSDTLRDLFKRADLNGCVPKGIIMPVHCLLQCGRCRCPRAHAFSAQVDV